MRLKLRHIVDVLETSYSITTLSMSLVTLLNIITTILGIGALLVLADSIALLVIPARSKLQTLLHGHYQWVLHLYLIVLGSISIIAPILYQYVFGFPPCTLCWYARILMWPAILITFIALYRKQLALLAPYLQILLSIGMFISGYHTLLLFGVTPELTGVCVEPNGVPCNVIDVQAFGFITLPFMALISFIGQLVLVRTITQPNSKNS